MYVTKENIGQILSKENIRGIVSGVKNECSSSRTHCSIDVTNQHTLKRIVDMCGAVYEYVLMKLKEGSKVTFSELNRDIVTIVVMDLQSKNMEAFNSGKTLEQLLNGVNTSKTGQVVDMQRMLKNVLKTITTGTLTGSIFESSQFVRPFGGQTGSVYNIGVLGTSISSDSVMTTKVTTDTPNIPLLVASSTTSSSSIQGDDPILTSNEYDEFIVSIDSRNRNVSINKYVNVFTTRMSIKQGDQLRGAIQNLNDITNVFEITLIDATLPNVISTSDREFDEPYIYMSIDEVDGTMPTTSYVGSRVFGKLRYDFSKVGDNFVNVYTDDCYRRYKQLQFLPALRTMTIRLQDYNGNPYDFGDDGMVITGTVSGNPTIVTTATNHTMATGNKVYIYDYRMDNVQRITFSAVPTSGVWSINYGTEQTVSLAFNATSLVIENALNGLATLSDVTVDGDYTNGFVVVFGSATLNTTPLVIANGSTTPVGTYTLVATATPIVTTVTDITVAFTNEVNSVNSSLGHTITNITATQFSIPVNTSYSGRNGYCILAKLQASFSFRIRTYGTKTY